MVEWTIRRQRQVEASVKELWPWVADPERISRWWCPPPTVTLHFEQRSGGRFEERYRDEALSYEVSGQVLEWSPPHRVSFQRHTPEGPASSDVITVTLQPEGDRTWVVLEHSFPELPEERRRAVTEFYAGPWDEALELLAQLAEGSQPNGDEES